MKKIGIIIFGIAIVVVGIVLLVNGKAKTKRCTEVAVATIVDIEKEETTDTDEDGITSTHYSYFPVLEYKAGEQTVTKKSDTGSGSQKYSVNDKVDILYNPNNIEEYVIKGDNSSNIISIIFIVVGVIIVAASLFLKK